MRRTAFFAGVRDMLPILAGGAPFGLIAGVAAAKVGFNPLEATTISGFVFAGAAQLASFDLLGRDAPYLVVLVTAVLINLRFAIYSAAIAPVFRSQPKLLRILYAQLLTDHAYVLTASRRLRDEDAPHPVAYYLGCAIPLWFMWTSTTFIGAAAGASIPKSWSLDFAVPLSFIALLVPTLKDRRQLLCAAITAGAALLLLEVPHGGGVILSILTGIGAGALLDRWSKK